MFNLLPNVRPYQDLQGLRGLSDAGINMSPGALDKSVLSALGPRPLYMHTGTRYVSKPHPILLEPSKHGKRHGKTSVHTLGLRMRFQWEAGVKEDCQYMIVQRIGLESLTVRESESITHTNRIQTPPMPVIVGSSGESLASRSSLSTLASVSMHAALQLTEISEVVCEFLDLPTLAHLACTCRAFEVPALDALWKVLPGVEPLAGLLPDSMWISEEDPAR